MNSLSSFLESLGIKKIIKNDSPDLLKKIIEDPYSGGRHLKLRINLEQMDKIYTNIHGKLDLNNKSRVDYIFRRLFRYEGYIEKYKLYSIVSKYEIDMNVLMKSVFIHKYKETEYVFYTEYHNLELYIWNVLTNLNNTTHHSEDIIIKNTKLDIIQKSIINECLKNSINIIIGAPGTGKTELIGNIMSYYDNVLICAPTGCAVKSISKRFNKKDILKNMIICTLHAFYCSNKDDILDFILKPDKLIIIDEFSMVDIFIFYNILWKIFNFEEYCKGCFPKILKKYKKDIALNNTNIILVGDYNQLPSIKAGNLLKDFVFSGKFAVHKLKKSYRSNNGILRVLTCIQEHKTVKTCKNSIEVFKYESPDSFHKILNNKNIYYYFYDEEKTILCPTNNIVDDINNFVQIFNPNKKIGNTGFKIQDKVIFLKNEPDYDLYNGTILYIKNIEIIIENNNDEKTKKCKIIFEDGHKFECILDELKIYLKLCYAMTIHKSQSGEFSIVFLILNYYPKIMWDIKLIYTAISRAKNICYISGSSQEINNSCKVDKSRITFLTN